MLGVFVKGTRRPQRRAVTSQHVFFLMREMPSAAWTRSLLKSAIIADNDDQVLPVFLSKTRKAPDLIIALMGADNKIAPIMDANETPQFMKDQKIAPSENKK
jgi:hypothetical protein